ncbi:hypothetical protein GCM10009554_43850 [Kribbella koreensis]|uniref:Restriction endonuclease n=1 Tax=Kribbella koreensis TaxID=57909 RepID=A0ABN1QTE6_9ACTN
MTSDDLLFSVPDLRTALDQQRAAALNEIMTMSAAEFLAWREAELNEELVSKYSVSLPVLGRDGAHLASGVEDTVVTMRGFRPQYGYEEVSTTVVLVVPFEGDAPVLKYRATTYTANPPFGEYKVGELRLTWSGAHAGAPAAAAIRNHFDERLDRIQEHLIWSRSDINQHHDRLRHVVAEAVATRRSKLLADRALESALGYPLRKRIDAAAYESPIKRRQVTPAYSPRARKASRPEPFLADEQYEDALSVLRNGRNLLERSPSLTVTLGEERIRDILLLLLNAQFEGKAVGEAFNREGKTDILIRSEDRNVFIAECKIWDGPKTVRDGLDQLLSYLAWRDTKAALVLFIRHGEPSVVIEKAIAVIKKHPNFKAVRTAEGGERYDFVMHATGDSHREIRLAFLPFALQDRPMSS